MYGFYYDPTYVMVLIGVVICMLASANVNRTFQKYSRIRSHSGMTGVQSMTEFHLLQRGLTWRCRLEIMKMTD